MITVKLFNVPCNEWHNISLVDILNAAKEGDPHLLKDYHVNYKKVCLQIEDTNVIDSQ